MNKVVPALAEYLHSKEHSFDLDEKDVLHASLKGVDGNWRFAAFEDNAGRFSMVSFIPLHATKSRCPACIELFARINGELGLGHFDYDFSDGELTYRTSVPLSKRGRLSVALIEDVIRGHHVIVDRFLPAISAVLFAGFSPERALTLAGNEASDAGNFPGRN
jgi:hypothetical protein